MMLFVFIFGNIAGFVVSLDHTTTPTVTPQLCKVPFAPNNGSVAVWGNNVLLEYTCNHGLQLIGSSFGSCNTITNRWSIQRPICVSSDCDPPSNVTNGRLYFKHNGSIVKTVCNHGYRLLGSRQRYCDGYKWVGKATKCKEKYSPVVGRRQARDHTTTTAPTEQKILDEHILDADNTCYKRFTEPPSVEHARVDIIYEFDHVAQDWVLIAKYTCGLGYQYSDNTVTYLYCKDYKWIGPKQPSCVNAEAAAENPCDTKNGRCEHICIYIGGTSYKCECYVGYTLGEYRRRCEDIDECEFDNGGCEQNCVNMIGSYFCTCNTGYATHGNQCYDKDECSIDGGHVCDGECINVPGSYECRCTQPGFQQSYDKKSCVDYDECKDGTDECDDYCVNTVGSYTCKCLKKGYRLSDDGQTCVDINECERYKKSRCKHGQCINQEGSFTCTCDPGYKEGRSKKRCFDINECKVNNGGCSEVCVNTRGNYTCSCHKHGYKVHGYKCEDHNECEENNGGCGDLCINIDGSYSCSCTQENYKLAEDGHSCIECSNEEFYDNTSRTCVPCPENSIVSHNVSVTQSVYDCKCLPGFIPESNDGCSDINECTDGHLSCDQICVNTPGSAHCECRSGYTLMSLGACSDIDECLSHPCSQQCNNTDGSYNCYCMEGFYLDPDNHTCIDYEECVDDLVWCEHQCINTIGSAYCTCDKGYELNTDTNNTCRDIDECQERTHVCEETCINTVGSYKCDCLNDGFKLSWDLASCSDINECMEGENECTNGCINTPGSYQCLCDIPGYTTSPDEATCQDIDECTDADSNTCSEVCINTDGSYRCDCFTGHALISFGDCAPCSVGYYRDNSTVECEPCPFQSTTKSDGSKSITDCFCIEGYTGNITLGEDCTKTEDD